MGRAMRVACFMLLGTAFADQTPELAKSDSGPTITDLLRSDDTSGQFPGAQGPAGQNNGFHQQPGGGSVSAALGGGASTDPMANMHMEPAPAPAPVLAPAPASSHHKETLPKSGAPASGFVGNMLSAAMGGGMTPSGHKPHALKGIPGTAMVSTQTQQITAGVIEAFMHKVQLLPGEKQCLEDNVATATSDVSGTIMDGVKAIKLILSGQKHKDRAASSTGGALSAGIDGAIKITSLVTSTTSLLKNCVQGDALFLLNQTGHNFINGSYLERTLMVNGIDIAHALSDSIIAYEAGDYHKFGSDIGTTLRKVLLSNATNTTNVLPEGLPEKKLIADASAGLMSGFFAGGSNIRITDDLKSDVNLKVDLHQCIAENGKFFREIWMGIWDLIAKFAVNKDQHGLDGNDFLGDMTSGSSQWNGELMMALMLLPNALEKCNINPQAQHMLLEAIQTMGHVHVKFKFPDDKINTKDGTKKVAKAVEAWTNWDFNTFGLELGKLLREFVMLGFPKKYSVDGAGRLHRTLFSEENFDHTETVIDDQPTSPPIYAFAAGFGVIGLMMVSIAVRISRRDQRHVDDVELEQLVDLEDIEVE